jgi:hypothetical protein
MQSFQLSKHSLTHCLCQPLFSINNHSKHKGNKAQTEGDNLCTLPTITLKILVNIDSESHSMTERIFNGPRPQTEHPTNYQNLAGNLIL